MKSLRLVEQSLIQTCKKAKTLLNLNNSQIKSYIETITKHFDEYRELIDEEVASNPESAKLSDYLKAEQLVEESKMYLLSMQAEEPIHNPTSDLLQSFLQNQNEMMSRVSINNGEPTRSSVKLPTLQIPNFSGDFTQWSNFHDVFTSTIHNSTTLDKIQKFQYLKSVVKGEAGSLINSIAITERNYDVAWVRLVQRYNKPYLITSSIINKFLNCEQVSQSGQNLKKIFNTLSETLGLLESQGSYASSRDPWVIALMLNKLDTDTKKEWAEQIPSLNSPDLDSFVRFLDNKCSAIDVCGFENSQKRDKKQSFTPHHVNFSSVSGACFVCNNSHPIHKCSDYLKLSRVDREKLISKEKRCFNCFRKGHNLRDCQSKFSCLKCGKKHHTTLHSDGCGKVAAESSTSSLQKIRTDSSDQESEKICNTSLIAVGIGRTDSSHVFLPTAIVNVLGPFKNLHPVCALLDTGAQSSFITESLVRELGVKINQVRIPISCFGGSTPMYSKGHVTLRIYSKLNPQFYVDVNAHVVPKIIEKFPSTNVYVPKICDIRREYSLADPKFNIAKEVSLILSASVFFEVLKSKRWLLPDHNLFVTETHFGHIITTREELSETLSENSKILANLAVCGTEEENLENQLENFWKIEEAVVDLPRETNEDNVCENLFQKTTRRLLDGRFVVSLPFRKNVEFLGHSFQSSLRRFHQLESRMQKDKELYETYKDFMRDYEDLGHMQRTDLGETDLCLGKYFILPHHGIWQRSSNSKKLRVVFDASAKTTTGISLNDALYPGPALQSDLFFVILRFRLHKYVMSADIQKMYSQILVEPKDTDYQLILWRDSIEKPISIYRLLTVTYGASCSPFLALRSLKELLNQDGHKFQEAARVLSSQRFVDDIFWGSDNIQKMKSMTNEIKSLLELGGFCLRKWITNEPSCLKEINLDELANPLIFSTEKCDSSIRTLGIKWYPGSDFFSYDIHLPSSIELTKRNLLSEMAKLFDPLGWIAPVVIKYKILMQETWVRRLKWDSLLPCDISDEWCKLRDSIPILQQIEINREIGAGILELHGFSDASERAYSAVVFARVKRFDNSIRVRLLMAKTKLSPIKQISIPRLELCGAQLLATMISSIRNCYSERVTRTYLYCDSKVVLAWLLSLPKRWSSFVGNRVSHINEICKGIPWVYVKSKENPADVASRGLHPDQLVNSTLWWNGPEFLKQADYIPITNEQFGTTEEEKPLKVFAICCSQNSIWETFILRFSDLNGLINSMAYVLRARDWFRGSRVSLGRNIAVEEYRRSLRFIISTIQRTHFEQEYESVLSGKLSVSKRFRRLSPFVDSDSILRVRGRLHNSNFSLQIKQPIILPSHHLVSLMIRDIHYSNFHLNQSCISNKLNKEYHIFGMNKLIRNVLSRCVRCSRYNGKTFSPPIGPLPESRFYQGKPFTHTGVDFAGPFNLRPAKLRGNLNIKGYISVFICMSTKAIHLELVTGLSTDCLIMSMQRFVSRRGLCTHIYSDNGTNFVGCDRHLREFYKDVTESCQSDEFHSFLLKNKIIWHFNPPYAPNFGGLWEAAVKSVKTHLKKTFNDVTLTIDEFQTALCRIESILNSRPLTPITSKNTEPITPNHFLIGSSEFNAFECLEPTNVSVYYKKRLKEINLLVQTFWRRWRNEYIPTLSRKPKWFHQGKCPSVGELVLIKHATDPPKLWRMGEITKLYPGKDSVTRVVDVKTIQGLRREAIRNLIPLNVDA